MTIYLEADHWAYEVFPLDEASETFGVFSSFVDLWVGKGQKGKLPAWRDFDLEDLVPWIGWVSVVDLIALDPFDMKYRLWGQAVAEAFGEDITGRNFLSYPGGIDDDDIQFLEYLVKQRQLGRWSGPVYWNDREFVTVCHVSMPLADDGETIDKIMNLTMRVA